MDNNKKIHQLEDAECTYHTSVLFYGYCHVFYDAVIHAFLVLILTELFTL